MDFESIFNKAADLRLLAQRLVEAAAAKDEQLVIHFVATTDTAMSGIVMEVELENPVTVLPPQSNEREDTARQMLHQYHDLMVTYKIKAAIMERMSLRLGPTHEMTISAIEKRNQAYSELEALTWTILELMGVDS